VETVHENKKVPLQVKGTLAHRGDKVSTREANRRQYGFGHDRTENVANRQEGREDEKSAMAKPH